MWQAVEEELNQELVVLAQPLQNLQLEFNL